MFNLLYYIIESNIKNYKHEKSLQETGQKQKTGFVKNIIMKLELFFCFLG